MVNGDRLNGNLSQKTVIAKNSSPNGDAPQEPPAYLSGPNRIVFRKPASLVPELLEVGKDRFTKATPRGLNHHAHQGFYEICYIMQGHVRWWVEGTVFEVNRGDIFITKPNEIHGGADEVMHPCDLYWLIVRIPEDHTPLTGLSVSETVQLARDLRNIHCRVFPGFSSTADHLAHILAEHHQPSAYASLIVRARLQQLLISVIQAHLAYIQADPVSFDASSDPIQQAKQWIELHLAESYHIEQVAQAVNMSVSYFHHRFLAETGLTPLEYRTQRRIQEAKRLLRTDDRPILQISQALGFSTSQYFATVFKKLEGLTPRQYRCKWMG